MWKVGGLDASCVEARILFSVNLTWCNSSLKQQTDLTNDDPIQTKYYRYYLQYESHTMNTNLKGRIVIGIHLFKNFYKKMCTPIKINVKTTPLNI